MRILTAAVLPLVLLSAACDIRVDERGISSLRITEGRAEDVWTRTYTLAANGRLEITGQNGDIEVRAAAGSQVEVRAEREVRANSDDAARELLEALRMREEVSAERVSISAEGERAEEGLGRRAQVRVHYRVRVPAGLTLAFRTENGGIQLENVNGRITASTTNGGITGSDIAGSLAAETVNGGIRVDLASVAGDVRLATTNGGVRLTLPANTKASLEASCVNGGIEIDERFGVEEPEGRTRRVAAPINGGGPTISASTVNGGIRIRARESAQTD
jgi:DUF4097 and DUF4098 domain-containing protein YvlB